MVVDYNKFKPFQPLQDNLLIVLEQIPGYIVWEDKTDHLRTYGYWSSYNLPYVVIKLSFLPFCVNMFYYGFLFYRYFPLIYNISGVYDSYLKYGDFFSYTKSPRAQIFSRDNTKVVDLNSMIALMRFYKNFNF